MRTLITLFISVLVLGTVLGFSPDAAAQTITVEVRSIAASKTGDSFDSKLSGLRGNLERAFGGYTSFKQVGNTTFSLKEKGSNAVTLPNKDTLTVTFNGKAGNFIKLGLAIGGRLNTTLRASPGSTFFQAGLNYNGDMLILAITVR